MKKRLLKEPRMDPVCVWRSVCVCVWWSSEINAAFDLHVSEWSELPESFQSYQPRGRLNVTGNTSPPPPHTHTLDLLCCFISHTHTHESRCTASVRNKDPSGTDSLRSRLRDSFSLKTSFSIKSKAEALRCQNGNFVFHKRAINGHKSVWMTLNSSH